MKIVNNEWLCEFDKCVCPACNCKDCEHCIDGLYYAELETEIMLKENPEYIDGDGNLQRLSL